ncbi:MAG TPA: pilus assembly protein N-terminal domain-containing protein [Anaeromyxobacteraceae bacterium]|nr:pilus assembly protein N-terminal domain-containing protein [Anaeromyxobacteraceae bacterium]
MRVALMLSTLALPALAAAGAPVVLVERQALTLEFTQAVQRLAVSDPEAIGLKAAGSTVKVRGLRAGRVQLDVVFADGATASYDVTVEPLQRPAVRPLAPDELELSVGQERVVPSPPGSQVLLEDNGVARAVQDGRGVVVRGVAPGAASLVVVEPSGARTTWKLRVR